MVRGDRVWKIEKRINDERKGERGWVGGQVDVWNFYLLSKYGCECESAME